MVDIAFKNLWARRTRSLLTILGVAVCIMLFLFMVGTTGYVEGNLDSAAGMAIAELFQTINKSGETIILVTHNREIAKYAGRTIVMRDGQIMGTL